MIATARDRGKVSHPASALLTRLVRMMASSANCSAEFFNIFNHTQFNNPTGNFSSGTFGQVTSARPPRIGQLSAKFVW